MAISSILTALGYYPKAHRAILRHRLWPYMILPGLMSFSFFIALISIGALYFGDIAAHIHQNYLPEFMKWGFLPAVTHLLLWCLLFLSGYILYQPVVLILFSPVLGYLSEITEKKILDGPDVPFQIRQVLKDVLRGLHLSLRNLIRMVLLVLSAWLMILIPIVGAVISAAVIFLIQAYFNGCALVDYTLERKNYAVRDRVRFTRGHRALVTGIGMGFMLLLIIPILGWFIAPAYGTVAATLCAVAAVNKNAGKPPSREADSPARR